MSDWKIPYGFLEQSQDIDRLTAKLAAAEAKNEQLRARVAELDEALTLALSSPLNPYKQSEARKALRGTSKPWLLRNQADAVEKFGQEIGVFDPEYDDQEYVEIPRREVKAYAQRLREQATELENGHEPTQ